MGSCHQSIRFTFHKGTSFENHKETIISYQKDGFGRTLGVRTNVGACTTQVHSEYDMRGRVIARQDEDGLWIRIQYENDGLLQTTTSALGGIQVVRYNKDGSQARQYASLSQDITYEYDYTCHGHVRRTKLTQNDTILSEVLLDGAGQVLLEKTPSLQGFIQTRHVYDSLGQLVLKQTGSLAPQSYQYNAMGELVKTVQVMAHPATVFNSPTVQQESYVEKLQDGVYQTKKTTTYNAQGQPLTTTQHSLISEHDLLESKEIFIDPLGNTTTNRREYAQGAVRVVKEDSPVSQVTAMQHVVDGFMVSARQLDGTQVAQQRVYDAQGMILRQTDARGNTSLSHYDRSSRLVSFADAQGNTTRHTYEKGLLSCTTNALGKTSCLTYDCLGRKVAEWGTAVQPIVYAYDQAGRLVSMKSFRAAEQKIEDNPMTRQDGDETLWSYDEATGLLLSKTYPDLHQELYGYDNMNRLTSKTQARQVDDRGTPLTTTYVYDEPSGRLLQVNHNDGTASTQYAYDHLGALTQASSSALDYQFAYDAQGRLSTQSSQGLGAHQLHYRYDVLNRLNSYALNYGGAQVLDSQLGYDVWGRLGEVRLNGAAQGFVYHYDAQGGYLKSMSYPHGLQKDITLEAQRDLPVAITYKKATDASFRWGNEYQFDALGRPINKKDYLNATQANLIHHYTHNDRHELISDAMSDGRVCAYDYDNIGNRKNAQEGNNFHRTYQTNELNQYVQGTQANGATFAPQYDADGNQTLILSDTGVWQVRYNALNQAVCFTKQAASQAGTEISVRIECEYDHMGRRVAKKVFEGGSMVSSKRYLYAGYLQIAELDAMVVAADEQAHPVLRKTYLWDPMHAKATRLLAMSRFDASGVKVEDLYYAQDMLKNTIALLDAQGASRALYEYDPYGKVIKMQGDLARENPFRHSCEYADDETGLVYYNYRYYNAQDGRWINRDPIAERGGLNLYTYVGNKVSWLWDELGQAPSRSDIERATQKAYALLDQIRECFKTKPPKCCACMYNEYLEKLSKLMKDAGEFYADLWWISDRDQQAMQDVYALPQVVDGARMTPEQSSMMGDAIRETGESIENNIFNKHREGIGNGADFAAGFSDGILFGQGENVSKLLHGSKTPWPSQNSGWYVGGVGTGIAISTLAAGGSAVGRFGVNSTLVGKGGYLFGRGGKHGAKGIFNSGRIRIGWSWKGTKLTGKNVFRISWSKPTSRTRCNHIDFN